MSLGTEETRELVRRVNNAIDFRLDRGTQKEATDALDELARRAEWAVGEQRSLVSAEDLEEIKNEWAKS